MTAHSLMEKRERQVPSTGERWSVSSIKNGITMEEKQRRRLPRKRWQRLAPWANWSRWGRPLLVRGSAMAWELPKEPLAVTAATIFYLPPPPGQGSGAILLPMAWIDGERHPAARRLPRLLTAPHLSEATITWRWAALAERGGARWILRYTHRAPAPLSFEVAFELPTHLPFLDAVHHVGELVLLTTAPPRWPGGPGHGGPVPFPAHAEQVWALRREEIRIQFPPDLAVRLESEVERWYEQHLVVGPADASVSSHRREEEEWQRPSTEPFHMIGEDELLAQAEEALPIEAAGWMKIETATAEEHLQALWLNCDTRPDILAEVARIHAGKAVVGYGQWLFTPQHVVLSYGLTAGCVFTLVFDLLLYRRLLQQIARDGHVAIVFRSMQIGAPIAGHADTNDLSPGLKVPVSVPRDMPGWLVRWRPPSL